MEIRFVEGNTILGKISTPGVLCFLITYSMKYLLVWPGPNFGIWWIILKKKNDTNCLEWRANLSKWDVDPPPQNLGQIIKKIKIELLEMASKCELKPQGCHMGHLLKEKRQYYKNKEHFEKIKNVFTPLDKGFIKHLTTIFNYLQCFLCMLDYLETAVTI